MAGAVLQLVTARRPSEPSLVDRVAKVLEKMECTRVWVRGVGRHVLLGLNKGEPIARLTSLGAGSYGLAFAGSAQRHTGKWELLLVDELESVVEHALVGAGALSFD